MSRERLPDRRPAVTRDVVYRAGVAAHAFTVTVGFCPHTGRALEVFAGGRTGTEMAAFIADACVTVSKLLQRGETARALYGSLHMTPVAVFDGEEERLVPASVLGAIVAAIIEEEGLA